MAKSGQYVSNKYSEGCSLIFNWSVASQDVVSNSSTINWNLTIKANTASLKSTCSTSYPDTINVYVDENKYTELITSDWALSPGSSKVLASGSTVIYHQTFDAQAFTFSFDTSWELSIGGNTTVNFGWDVGVQSAVIDYIVRSASIQSVTPDSPTDEDTFTINYQNPAGDYATSLTVYANFSDGTTAFAARSMTKTASTYTLTPTTTDKNKLYAKLNAGYTQLTLKFYVKSVVPAGSGSKTVVSGPISKTLKFINYMPTIAPTVVENDSDVYNLTQTHSTMVKGMSDAYFTLNAAAVKGATVVRKYITNGDKLVENVNTGTIVDINSNTFYFYVEDSRGNVTKTFHTVNLLEYAKPTCKVRTENITTSGVLTMNLSGKYFSGVFGAVANKLYVDYKVYPDTSSVPASWTTKTLTPSVDAENNYTSSFTVTGLDYEKRYKFVVRVYDELSTSAEVSGLVSAEPIFDWSKEDFCFYVPVEMQEGFKYTQNLLWSGVEQMGNGTTIQLSAPVSEQPTGIVLVFSLYRDTVEDASIHSFFVSRKQIELLGGRPHMFMMGINSNLSIFGSKYIYISDDELSGFSGNSSASTAACGITFDNTKFVLRYVIGV